MHKEPISTIHGEPTEDDSYKSHPVSIPEFPLRPFEDFDVLSPEAIPGHKLISRAIDGIRLPDSRPGKYYFNKECLEIIKNSLATRVFPIKVKDELQRILSAHVKEDRFFSFHDEPPLLEMAKISFSESVYCDLYDYLSILEACSLLSCDGREIISRIKPVTDVIEQYYSKFRSDNISKIPNTDVLEFAYYSESGSYGYTAEDPRADIFKRLAILCLRSGDTAKAEEYTAYIEQLKTESSEPLNTVYYDIALYWIAIEQGDENKASQLFREVFEKSLIICKNPSGPESNHYETYQMKKSYNTLKKIVEFLIANEDYPHAIHLISQIKQNFSEILNDFDLLKLEVDCGVKPKTFPKPRFAHEEAKMISINAKLGVRPDKMVPLLFERYKAAELYNSVREVKVVVQSIFDAYIYLKDKKKAEEIFVIFPFSQTALNFSKLAVLQRKSATPEELARGITNRDIDDISTDKTN